MGYESPLKHAHAELAKAHEHLRNVHPADHEGIRKAHDRVADANAYIRECRSGVRSKESQR